MSPSRRLWLLSPLVVLTLFFGVYKWWASHLPNNEEEIWLLVADNFPQAGKKIMPAFPGQEAMPRPFHPRQLTILGIARDEWTGKPLPPQMLKKIRERHHGSRIENPSKKPLPHKNWWEIFFKRVHFESPDAACCEIEYFSSKEDPHGYITSGQIRLERSMIPFGDSRWRIVEYIPGLAQTA